MRDTLPVRHLVPAMTEREALDLTNKPTFLARTDVDHIVTTSEVGVKPDGTLLYVRVNNVIPYEYCAAAYPVAQRIATAPITNRPIAAGAYMERRLFRFSISATLEYRRARSSSASALAVW